ncbi:exportin-XPO7 [Acrasis kona]|uniref:Exportin-XPO7 n=1 Tax=Acrasis kona TaxID=1008807 RepID=A0AAW2ZHH7_9EUKA
MNEKDLKSYEGLCEAIYGPEPNARKAAEQQLAMFDKVESVYTLKMVIERSSNVTAIFFSASQIQKLFTNNWNSFTSLQKAEIRNFLLNYMGKVGAKLPEHTAAVILQLLGRMTKMGWMEELSNRELPEQIKQHFGQSSDMSVRTIGLQILRSIIEEMNTLAQRKSITQHRKVAVSFRDLALRGIFETAIHVLRDAVRNGYLAVHPKLYTEALGLITATLKFDFVGIFPDESTEDVGTIQIPAGWRSLFEEGDILQLFWDLYASVPTPTPSNVLQQVQTLSLKVLVLLSSIRRSLFQSDDDRKKYLTSFVDGIIRILTSKQGLNVTENYHQFCRLLARLKSNFQLNEFIICPNYNQWLSLVANFSIESFKSWKYSGQSVFYILNLWSRLVASKPYLKQELDSQLDTYVPEVTKQFITSRLEFARACANDDAIENPLEHKEILDEQLDALPQLVHADYEKLGIVFTNCFDPTFASYTNAIRSKNSNIYAECELQLTWLIYMFGSIIGKRYAGTGTTVTSDASEIIDGNLTARVLQTATLIGERLAISSSAVDDDSLQHLENAVIYFMKHFKRIYLGDAMISHSKIYTRLQELMNLQDQLQLLEVFMNKIANNLKIWAQCESIIKQTISLFDDIATGYCSAKYATKLEITKMLLTRHSADNFPFLKMRDNIRQRTTFYHTLCKLLFLQNYTEDDFLNFMKPFDMVCTQLRQINESEFAREDVMFALTGWLRDMRGVCMGCSSKKTYQYLFDWLYPRHFPLLLKTVQVYSNKPSCMTALLKFVLEFSLNKSTRISFGPCSPNGILLFKEISALLVTFGQRAFAANSAPSLGNGDNKDEYDSRYKSVSICMKILTSALNGNYCNFGVFSLYNDRSLIDCLDVVIRLSLAIPLNDIISYPKMTRNYFSLVETLFHNHLERVIEFDSNIFLKLVSSLEEGVKLEDLNLSSQICASLDHLCTFYYAQVKKQSPQAVLLSRHLQQSVELFPRLLHQFFHLIIYEDCGNQWSVSRTMLSLIVINPAMFEETKNRIIIKICGTAAGANGAGAGANGGANGAGAGAGGVVVDETRRNKIVEAFDKLMEGVEMNLEPKTRDKFTGNLITFRQDVRQTL